MNLVKSKPAVWMRDYAPGWIGFEFRHDDFISAGIRWFEKWDESPEHAPSHTFVVTGPNECIEAQARGVVRSDLQKYFGDPHCVIWFRKPLGWTPDMGKVIVAGAEAELGKKYAFAIIAADFVSNTLVGHLVDRLTLGWLDRTTTKLAESSKEDICSMVSAKALNSVPALTGRGVLQLPAREITPANLDEDKGGFVFEPRGATV